MEAEAAILEALRSAGEFMGIGLRAIQYAPRRPNRVSLRKKNQIFRGHYGCSPGVAARLWEDLLRSNDPEICIAPNETTPRIFLAAMHKLKLYPTDIVSSVVFREPENSLRTDIWWVLRRVAKLAKAYFKWPFDSADDDDDSTYCDEDDDDLNGEDPLTFRDGSGGDDDDDGSDDEVPPLTFRDGSGGDDDDDDDDKDQDTTNTDTTKDDDDESYVFVERDDVLDEFFMTIDTVHCRCNEPSHPIWRKNPKYYSHKFAQAAYSYELGISIFEDRVLWVNGPYPAGKSDIVIFRERLKDKIPLGKKILGDKGYRGEPDTIKTHNALDGDFVRTMKKRALARHEAFNKRIKDFDCLKNRFRHGKKKFRCAFLSVTLICQYEMEAGAALFNV